MSSFMIELTDEEILHISLAVARAIKGNSNKDAVETFENILSKLNPYLGDASKMSVNMAKFIWL